MKLEKLKEEKKKNKLTILLKGEHEVFANTIRRLIVEEVPTLAVEDLEIKDNSSALYDEMLGLRLGLTPIKTDLKSYTFREQCKCEGEGCARCQLTLTLKVGRKGYAYAEDAESTDPKCTFALGKMPIVKLLARQKVDLTMTAILGRGKEHIKWSPGWAYYRQEAQLTLGKVADPAAIAAKCTDGVLQMKGNKLDVDKEKVQESILLEHYASLDKNITIEYTGNILFTVESWGQLSCREMLSRSAEILEAKAEELERQL